MEVRVKYAANGYHMVEQFEDLRRCPHCAIASPRFVAVWASVGFNAHTDDSPDRMWGAYRCASCGSLITLRGIPNAGQNGANIIRVDAIFPPAPQAHDDIPPSARRYLQQALETLHAPDAAAMIAGSAVDAMLKELGYHDGNLYSRIDKALADNVLTQGMADWAHSVRLGSNRPRHADKDAPHVSPEEAKQSVEFAESLGSFLFVLTAKIQRGIRAAESASHGENEGCASDQ